MLNIEHRLLPAMFGACLLAASLFWIGWTANPQHKPYIPIIANGFYVWGSASTLIGFVGYLFDAYPHTSTLSALTVAAVGRLMFAGIIPLLIVQAVTDLGGAWALSVFGFIGIAFLAFPVVIYVFGKRMMSKSRWSEGGLSWLGMEMEGKMNGDGSQGGMNGA